MQLIERCLLGNISWAAVLLGARAFSLRPEGRKCRRDRREAGGAGMHGGGGKPGELAIPRSITRIHGTSDQDVHWETGCFLTWLAEALALPVF
jgi:hypothetical protein